MADALTTLHQIFQEIPDLEAMAVDKNVELLKQGLTIDLKSLSNVVYNKPVKWFSLLALNEYIYLNHSRSMVPFRGNAWSKFVFLDDQFKVELIDSGTVVKSETLLVSSENYCKVTAQNENQKIKITLVTSGKFREIRKTKENLHNLTAYLEQLKQELIESVEIKHNISSIKEWLKILGIMSTKENIYFKDRKEINTFIESRPLTLIPVKDCLHLRYVISEMALSKEISEQVFFEKPAQIQYRKMLKDILQIA